MARNIDAFSSLAGRRWRAALAASRTRGLLPVRGLWPLTRRASRVDLSPQAGRGVFAALERDCLALNQSRCLCSLFARMILSEKSANFSQIMLLFVCRMILSEKSANFSQIMLLFVCRMILSEKSANSSQIMLLFVCRMILSEKSANFSGSCFFELRSANPKSASPIPGVQTEPGHACSSSTSVPQKSFGCRNRTGLPWAPIFGLPSPSTRAPSALSLSRATRMSSTS